MQTIIYFKNKLFFIIFLQKFVSFILLENFNGFFIDTKNIQFVFAAVKDTILQNNLKDYNLY